MDRRTRAFVVVGVAALLASAAAFGVYRAIQTRPVVRVPVASRFVVVAAKPIAVGTTVTAEMIRVAGWPADAPVMGGFAKPEDVLGRGVIVALVENEPLIESKMAPKGTAGLAPVVPTGMRAISVRVNDVISVAGFTLPGSRVDVIVTMRMDSDPISRIVLSNVRVLTTGQNVDTAQPVDGNRPASNPALVTLALTPTDAERLTLAATQGQIALALRNPMDVDQTETVGARMSALLGGSAPAPPPVRSPGRAPQRAVAPPPPPEPAKPPTIAVFAGTTRKETTVKKDGGGD